MIRRLGGWAGVLAISAGTALITTCGPFGVGLVAACVFLAGTFGLVTHIHEYHQTKRGQS